MLDNACTLEDLRSPPGNRLEALRGDLKGFWSIRINDQWRLCFRFVNSDALDVENVDYHKGGYMASIKNKMRPIHPGEI